MRTSRSGQELIKSFESCRLTSYKAVPTEEKYTIGYGHYGVKKDLTITKLEAEKYFAKDLVRAENTINMYHTAYKFNQNQFDALVCFAFNIGNIKQLTHNGTIPKSQISDRMLLFIHSGGREIRGLIIRRNKEYKLYTTPIKKVC